MYHNGICERATGDVLGPTDASGKLLTAIVPTDAALRALYADPAVRGSDRARFLNAGTSRSEMSQVSDVTVSIDVAPRNLRQ